MSITFETLPDIIIEEILSDLWSSDQIKLQYCNKRINQLLKYELYKSLSVSEDDKDLKVMAPRIGKYVKWLYSYIDKAFFEVKDEFPNLESIQLNEYHRSGVFDKLHLLNIKLKSFDLYLNEPFPTQLQFNFNHILKNLKHLDLRLFNIDSDICEVLDKFQISILNLKTLKLVANYFPDDLLVSINRNFPKLEELNLHNRKYRPTVILIPVIFLKLKRLTLSEAVVQGYHFPFQGLPRLYHLLIRGFEKVGESSKRILNENLFKRLSNLTIDLYKFSIVDASRFQNLEFAYLYLYENFNAESMQHLLSLPKLTQLTLDKYISDDLFKNVTCKSPLVSLTLFGKLSLSQHFLKLLRFNAPSLIKLGLFPAYGTCTFNYETSNESDNNGSEFEYNTFSENESDSNISNYSKYDKKKSKIDIFSGLDGQTNLNLLYLTAYKDDEIFINWVKVQSPNVYVI